jgi:hypothetical protein
MIAQRLIRTLVFLHYAAWSGAAVLTPPKIPEQPLIRTIYEWGDQIAAITETYQAKEKRLTTELYVVDPSISRAIPVRVPDCDAYHDVAYDARLGKLVLCGTGKSARVYKMSGAAWATVSEPVPGTGFRFAVDGDRIAIVSDGIVFVISASSNVRPEVIPLRIGMPPGVMPSALLLADGALFVAYDLGEFGGGLYWMELKRGAKPPTRVIHGNVAALARSRSGVIWAAGGLAHLSGLSAALYRVSGNRVEVVAAIGGFQGGRRFDGAQIDEKITEKAGVPFPGLTSLSGLSLGGEERPTVVLPAFGVFEFSGDRFVRLYEGELSFHYQMPTYGVGSHPVGLAIGQSGDLYVASRSLGIFVLRRQDDRYELKQLLFEDPAHDKRLDPAR